MATGLALRSLAFQLSKSCRSILRSLESLVTRLFRLTQFQERGRVRSSLSGLQIQVESCKGSLTFRIENGRSKWPGSSKGLEVVEEDQRLHKHSFQSYVSRAMVLESFAIILTHLPSGWTLFSMSWFMFKTVTSLLISNNNQYLI